MIELRQPTENMANVYVQYNFYGNEICLVIVSKILIKI